MHILASLSIAQPDVTFTFTNTENSGAILQSNGDNGIIIPGRDPVTLVAESLARLGRVKRVGLSIKDKVNFIDEWTKSKSKHQ